jgi:hypothetical protein
MDATPWARDATSPEFLEAAGDRARGLHAYLQLGARSPEGPYVVDLAGRAQHLRHTGPDLEEAVGELLERFRAGGSDHGIRWAAGPDHLAHGHFGRLSRTLCQRPRVDDRYQHPERARCVACLRALDHGRA